MKLLKRAYAITGKSYYLPVFLVTLLAEIAFDWYKIGQRYDLAKVSGSTGYTLGAMATLSVVIVAAILGITTGLLMRRYLPQPLPVDPDLPPTQLVYLQGDGEPEVCACHGNPIEDGTLIWHWPQPAKLVCVQKGHAQ